MSKKTDRYTDIVEPSVLSFRAGDKLPLVGIDGAWDGIQDKKPEMVNHPEHYNSDPSGVECIEVVRHRNFNVGNAMKYLWRAGLKPDADLSDRQKEIQDLRKAVWYINDEIERLSGLTIPKL